MRATHLDRTEPATVTPRRVRAAVLALLVGVLVAVPAAASAQPATASAQCDPVYGCGPPPPSQTGATCSLSARTAAPGDRVTSTVSHIDAGTEVSVAFDGDVVATGTATADSPGSQSGTAKIDWNVPGDASHGDHTVSHFGAGFSCDAKLAVSSAEVLGTSVSRGGSGGSLARTGFELTVYLVAALLLVLVGSRVLREGRRRQHEATRRRNRIHRLTPR